MGGVVPGLKLYPEPSQLRRINREFVRDVRSNFERLEDPFEPFDDAAGRSD